MFWAYFEMTVFPLLLLEVRGFFNSLHGDESGGACGDTLMEVWIPQPNTGSPCFKLSNLSTLNLQQLISYCLGFSTLVLVPTEVCDLVNCDSLYLSVSSVLRAVVCSGTSVLFWIYEELLTFSFHSFFLVM